MYQTVEERLLYLEKLVEKQAFQIRLLQSLVDNPLQNKLNQQVISSGMSERCYEKLRVLTYYYDQKLQEGDHVTLTDFIVDFEKTLVEDGVVVSNSFIAEFIPKWLNGTMGSKGHSPQLHGHFY